MNLVCLIGNIVNDLEVKQKGNVKYLNFTIAINTYNKDKEETDYIRCVAFNKTAEIISQYFQKGSKIALEGKISSKQYTDKNGDNKTNFNVMVSNVTFCERKDKTKSNDQEFNFKNVETYDLPF